MLKLTNGRFCVVVFAVSSVLRTGLLDRNGTRVRVARGFLTSDGQLAGAVKMKNYYIALSNGIRPLNSSKFFRKWMETRLGRAVLEVRWEPLSPSPVCTDTR